MAESPSPDEIEYMFDTYVKPLISSDIIEPTAQGKENAKQELRKEIIRKGKIKGNVDHQAVIKYYTRWFSGKAQEFAAEKSISATIKNTRNRGVEISKSEESEMIDYSQRGGNNYKNIKSGLNIMQAAGKGLTEKSKKSITEHTKEFGGDDIYYSGYVNKNGKMGMIARSHKKGKMITRWTIK